MNRKKLVLILLCFILFFSAFVLLKEYKDRLSIEVPYSSATEHNYFAIKRQIQETYSITSSHIKVITTERSSSSHFVLFTFMDERHSYIGQLTYIQEEPDNQRIPEERVQSLKIHSMKDRKTPFRLMTSIITVDQTDYCFYYGWINDMNVRKVEFDFIDARFEIRPDDQNFFYLLRNKNMKMNKTTALDANSLTIQEYTY